MRDAYLIGSFATSQVLTRISHQAAWDSHTALVYLKKTGGLNYIVFFKHAYLVLVSVSSLP